MGSDDATLRDVTPRDATRRGARSPKKEERPREEWRLLPFAAGKHVTFAQRHEQREEIVRRAPTGNTDRRRCQISPRARHEHGLVYEEVLETP